MDLQLRSSRVVYHNKTDSRVFGDPNDTSGLHESRLSKRYSTDGGSLSQRNPISGVNIPAVTVASGKKPIDFQPSKVYDALNKKRYMLPSDMKPLSELYNTKKYQFAKRKLSSSVFESNSARGPIEAPSKTKRLIEK